MEAATAADLTQASEIAGRYITLGSAAKGYVSDLTVARPRATISWLQTGRTSWSDELLLSLQA